MKIKKEKRYMKSQSLIPILILIACLCLLPKAQAVNPPPDGGYPGFNTAEGDNALKNLNTATGQGNTALGWFSLGLVTDGSFNTGVGAGALVLNTGSSNTGIGAAALILNTTGERNTAVGTAAMVNNAAGNDRILPSAVGRSLAILPAATTPPTERLPFLPTQKASRTQPPVILLWRTTPSAASTQPTVFKCSIATLPAISTRPTVLSRSLAIPKAASTRPTDLMRS